MVIRSMYFPVIAACALGFVMFSAQKQKEAEVQACVDTIDQAVSWQVELDHYQRTQGGFSGRIWMTSDAFVGSYPFTCDFVQGEVLKAVVLGKEVYPNESSS